MPKKSSINKSLESNKKLVRAKISPKKALLKTPKTPHTKTIPLEKQSRATTTVSKPTNKSITKKNLSKLELDKNNKSIKNSLSTKVIKTPKKVTSPLSTNKVISIKKNAENRYIIEGSNNIESIKINMLFNYYNFIITTLKETPFPLELETAREFILKLKINEETKFNITLQKYIESKIIENKINIIPDNFYLKFRDFILKYNNNQLLNSNASKYTDFEDFLLSLINKE